jgi:dethiobiotin synthetase
MQTYFISSNDTGVGKTHVGCLLLAALIRSQVQCAIKKPVESGCRRINGALITKDAHAYSVVMGKNLSDDKINAYRFEPPISPERAIRLSGQHIDLQDLVNACTPTEKCDVLLVEGAGGFYSPLTADGLNADLAMQLKAAVILVVPDRLGCINQTLLSLQAIRQSQLECRFVILNQYQPQQATGMNNLEDLQQYAQVPVVAIPHAQDASVEMQDMCRQSIQMVVDDIKQHIQIRAGASLDL